MADATEPPPLFDTIDISKTDDDNDDLFASAIDDDISSLRLAGNTQNLAVNGNADAEGSGDRDRERDGDGDRDDLNSSEEPKETANSLEPLTPPEPSEVPEPTPRETNNDEEVEKESGDQFIDIRITEPCKVGEGMGSYVAYKVQTRTNIKLFRRTSSVVLRRFSDFLGLHDKLVEKYLRAGRIIPPAPEKSVIGTTKIKMSHQTDQQGLNSEFVDRRRAALERYLTRTAAHPVLCVDPDFREFLECDGELPRAVSTSALSGAGVMRLFNKVGETVNKITYKMEETDPWFEDKTQHIESLDSQLRKLHSSVETLVLQRRDLASMTAAFARSTAMLSNCEEHTALSRALAQLAETEEKVEVVHNEQSNADFIILCELLKDYIALIGAIKDVFHERVKVFQNWQHSQQTLNKKREQKAKLEMAGKPDRGNVASMEVVEWQAKVERGQEEFDNISKMIKKEIERFEINRVLDFKSTIVAYLESLMSHQMQLVKYWEGFLPEAKAIA